MSRDYRALGRELRPGPGVKRRSLLGRLVGWVFRHLPEILLMALLIRAWLACGADRSTVDNPAVPCAGRGRGVVVSVAAVAQWRARVHAHPGPAARRI
ncbi:MAG: hypothetical protein ACRDRE_06105 [Pseudonocardiaceae bacterium]